MHNSSGCPGGYRGSVVFDWGVFGIIGIRSQGWSSGSTRGNVDRSSIMRFEDLLELWQRYCAQQSILEFLGIRSRGDVRGNEESDPGVLGVLHERLDGTWWEVTRPGSLTCNTGRAIRCRYLADSLKDALRRCPGAQFPAEALIDEGEDMASEDDAEVSGTTRSRRRSTPTAKGR